MGKPVRYLCLNKDTDLIKFAAEKQKYTSSGFNVVIYDNTSEDNNIQNGLYNIIKNHM